MNYVHAAHRKKSTASSKPTQYKCTQHLQYSHSMHTGLTSFDSSIIQTDAAQSLSSSGSVNYA